MSDYQLTLEQQLAAEIADALHMQAEDFRYRFRLPKDAPMVAVVPRNEEIGLLAFQKAAAILKARGITVDWQHWCSRCKPEYLEKMTEHMGAARAADARARHIERDHD